MTPGDAAGADAALGQVVGQPQALLHVGGAAGLQPVDGVQDGAALPGVGGVEQDVTPGAVDYDAHLVPGAQLVDQQAQGLLDQAQPVLLAHGAGDVDGKDEGGVLAGPVGYFLALDADAHQPVPVGAEGGGRTLHVDGKGVPARRRVPHIEVVDELLHPHRVRVGQVAILDEAAGHGIGCGIHVHGEGGQVVVLGVDEGVDPRVLEEGQVVGRIVGQAGAPRRGNVRGQGRQGGPAQGEGLAGTTGPLLGCGLGLDDGASGTSRTWGASGPGGRLFFHNPFHF